MRLFFALDLPGETARAVSSWRDRELGRCGRPVPAANFHITLAFVGDLPGSRLERLCLSVDQWLAGDTCRGAELQLDRTGYWQKAGIYWLGPSQWPQDLSLLAQKLGGLSSAAGGKRDKRSLQPHITLFRRCDPAPPAPTRPPSIPLRYDYFTLFESRQGKSGISYHPQQHWDLLRT